MTNNQDCFLSFLASTPKRLLKKGGDLRSHAISQIALMTFDSETAATSFLEKTKTFWKPDGGPRSIGWTDALFWHAFEQSNLPLWEALFDSHKNRQAPYRITAPFFPETRQQAVMMRQLAFTREGRKVLERFYESFLALEQWQKRIFRGRLGRVSKELLKNGDLKERSIWCERFCDLLGDEECRRFLAKNLPIAATPIEADALWPILSKNGLSGLSLFRHFFPKESGWSGKRNPFAGPFLRKTINVSRLYAELILNLKISGDAQRETERLFGAPPTQAKFDETVAFLIARGMADFTTTFVKEHQNFSTKKSKASSILVDIAMKGIFDSEMAEQMVLLLRKNGFPLPKSKRRLEFLGSSALAQSDFDALSKCVGMDTKQRKRKCL